MRSSILFSIFLFSASIASAANFDDLSCGTYLKRHQDPYLGSRFVNLLRGYLTDRGFISHDTALQHMDEVLATLDAYCLKTSPYERLINAAEDLADDP